MVYRKLTRTFYIRPTLEVARSLLGKYLVHQTPDGLVRGRIVETEAYAGVYDPASHTYRGQRTERNAIWYEVGGYAYVYQIYGSYVCLGIVTEPQHIPGAVLIRALEPIDGREILVRQRGSTEENFLRLCAGPSKLCQAMGINKACTGLDLCGDQLYLEEETECALPALSEIVFTPRINIDYAGAGALSYWRYCVRGSPALSRATYEPLRQWRVQGYPSQQKPLPLTLFTHLAQEEAVPMTHPAAAILRDLPKVELHLHLEGCMSIETLRTLCARHRQSLPAHLTNATQDRHLFATFAEFVYTYHRLCQALVQPQDFALLIDDLAAYIRRNRILYCEVSWTPFLYLNRGLHFTEIMETLNMALEGHGLRERVRFLIDIQRDHGLEAGAWVHDVVYATAERFGIVGVGLTGQEEGFPPAEYRELYQRAREHGLGCTAHAGEYGTPEDIWQCVQGLGVSRIGHGIRAIHDRRLVEYLAEHQIHLEICPSSNVRLQRVEFHSSHPIRSLWSRQVPLSINTDDPGLFGIDLVEEYLTVMEHQQFSLRELQQALLNSIAAAFLPHARKALLAQEIQQQWEVATC